MHSKKIINNSLIVILYKILMLVIGFVTRKIFIAYLGEEILGLNSLYSNVLELLNLADLGIGVAVQYQLYEPLVKKNKEKLSRILSAAKKIYNIIGVFIFVGGFVLSFFVHHLIKKVSYPIWFIQISFLISVFGIALGYFFVHEKLYLQANEEIGIVNIIDFIAKLLTVIISILSTILLKNYFLYLFINALYGLIGNIIIHCIFKRKYPDICENKKDIDVEIKELTSQLKNVVPMKLSNYVYNSTDNIIISKVLGLTTVAVYSNYITIINGLMGIEHLIGNVVSSSMGKFIKELPKKEEIFKYYLVYQYIQFLFTSFATVSLSVICEPFIKIWIGSKFLIEPCTYVLLILDFYIHSMYQPAYVMFGATGKFKDDKYITLISAVMNIVFSIVLVLFIGLPGVIMGTLMTDLYIWTVRTYQVVKSYYNQSLYKYFLKMLKYSIISVLGLVITVFFSNLVKVNNLLLEIVLKLIICLLVPNILNLMFTFKSDEFLYIKKIFAARGEI